MTLRIEFIKSKSHTFRRTLSIVSALRGFKESGSSGETVYSVEFEPAEYRSADAVLKLVGSWRGTAFYQDDQLVAYHTIMTAIFHELRDAQDVEHQQQLQKRCAEAGIPYPLPYTAMGPVRMSVRQPGPPDEVK